MARKRRDPLRSKLDQLAEMIADEALDHDSKLTLAQRVSALKTAGAYMVASRKGTNEQPPSKFDEYFQRFGTATPANGEAHDDNAAEDLS